VSQPSHVVLFFFRGTVCVFYKKYIPIGNLFSWSGHTNVNR